MSTSCRIESQGGVGLSYVAPSVEETRLENVPQPSASAAPRTQSLFAELASQRDIAEAARNDGYKNKPPRGIDEEDEMFFNARDDEDKTIADRERSQANHDRQEFQVRRQRLSDC